MHVHVCVDGERHEGRKSQGERIVGRISVKDEMWNGRKQQKVRGMAIGEKK